MTNRVSTSRIVAGSADEVFKVITDISRLPEWNRAITAVIERPEHLYESAQWTVEICALGRTWQSRSTVETLDPIGRCFAYRSAPHDGNPSFALWTWVVAPHHEGALVTVASELHPLTFVRRMVLVRIRAWQLGHSELMQSLVALETATHPAHCAIPGPNPGGSQ